MSDPTQALMDMIEGEIFAALLAKNCDTYFKAKTLELQSKDSPECKAAVKQFIDSTVSLSAYVARFRNNALRFAADNARLRNAMKSVIKKIEALEAQLGVAQSSGSEEVNAVPASTADREKLKRSLPDDAPAFIKELLDDPNVQVK